MGGELWIRFSSAKERDKCFAYLDGVEGFYVKDIEPKCMANGYNYIGDTWLNWDGYGHGKTVLELGHSAGAYNAVVSYAVASEIAKRFRVTRLGADSVGWYDSQGGVPDKDNLRYHGAATWAEWLKVMSVEDTYEMHSMMRFDKEHTMIVCKAIAEQIRAAFDNLDKDIKPPQEELR